MKPHGTGSIPHSPARGWPGAGGATAVCAAVLTVLVAGCQSQTTFRTVDLTPPERITEDIPESHFLDVGIAVFDPNVPDTYDAAQQSVVNPEVRRAESYYMPYKLKTVVESTGNWGAVRVVPEPTHAVDVLVSGRILQSQGERLVLAVRARDARGVVWFDKTYEALASKYAYGEDLPRRADPFQHIYTRIADDLAAHFVELTGPEALNIRRTAKMQFARDILPAAYDDYVERTEAGNVVVNRLPAEDDPVMAGVRQVRQREFMFIDTLDGHYGEYHRRIQPIYQTWRKAAYNESMARLELGDKRRRQIIVGTISLLAGVAGGPATFTAIPTGAEMLKESFAQKNEAELHTEALREVSSSMESKAMPYTLELENKTVELTGTVEEQFAKLRALLRKSYYESLDLPVPQEAGPATHASSTTQAASEPQAVALPAEPPG